MLNQVNYKLPYIFVVGNEKGGAGKTTCSIHLITSLLDKGFKVAAIDVDCRQKSLTAYLNNRQKFINEHPELSIKMPEVFALDEATDSDIATKNANEKEKLEQVIEQALASNDILVIDTPGSATNLSRIAHSYADTVITPINDSFVDLDVIAKIEGEDLNIVSPSIYSQLIWEQKMARAQRDRGSINWFVMRNRLGHAQAKNKQNIELALEKLCKRVAFTQAPGFSERVIFRELFLDGLTLVDLLKLNMGKNFSSSHLAARQELRNFLKMLQINKLEEVLATKQSNLEAAN